MSKAFHSGFVAIVGRPNVGKSTLLNQILGQKVAIMSEKAQTTRNKIQGVYTTDDTQIVFLDTPGIHKPHSKMAQYMVKSALNTLQEVDAVLFLLDVTQALGGGDRFIIEQFAKIRTPVYAVLNKIDLVHPHDLLPYIEKLRHLYEFAQIVPVSALLGNNVQALLAEIGKVLPEGPKYYPEDQITDRPEQFLVAELVREKVLRLTREEVPHAVAVVIEEMTPRETQAVYVRAVIYVERKSQKGILIGKGGNMLKEVGRLAREEMETLLGSRIYLDLWVKVKDDWRNRDDLLERLGYREK